MNGEASAHIVRGANHTNRFISIRVEDGFAMCLEVLRTRFGSAHSPLLAAGNLQWLGLRLLFLFMTVVAAACAFPGQTKKEIIHTYVLNPEGAPAEGRGGPGKGASAVLLVNLPQAQSGFDTERIAYLKRSHEVSYYAASEWTDPPARMLAPLLVQALERSQVWRTVVQMPSAVRGDYRLDSDHLTLAQEFFERPSRVRLTLRTQLIDLQRARPVGTKTFEILEEAPSEDAYGGVIAANRAVAKLLDEVAVWVRDCTEADPRGAC